VKVLHVIPSVSPSRGGPTTVLRTFVKALVSNGVEIDVVTTNDDGPGFLDQPLDTPVLLDGARYFFFRRNCRFYTVSWGLARWLDRHCSDYDLVHIHALFSFSSTVAARCARRCRVPYIIRPLGTLNRWGRDQRRPFLKKISLKFIESPLLQGAAAVHFTSEREKLEAYEVASPGRSIVLPNPVALEKPTVALAAGWLRTRYPSLGQRKIILFLSRLDPKKGFDLLFEAFALVAQRTDDVVLVVSGDGEKTFVAGLHKMVVALGIGDRVVWTGFIDGLEKYAAFEEASVFVLPSYSENFGVSVVEAMSHGLPAVVSNQVALHREIADANAGLVVPCAAPELGAALLILCTDTQLRNAAGRQGRRLAARFSPDVVAKDLVAAYQEVVRSRPILKESLAC
jgi:glycosyltransferase involved in cell wall biosynthesis